MSKFAIVFPGQGSQYVGMGKQICDLYPVAAQTFEEANDSLGFDLQKLCFEGSIEDLTKTYNTQPAILTVSMAMFRVFMQEIGVVPDFAAGHSLGEFSALCSAGALEFSQAVKLVRKRGTYMQEAVPVGIGSMAAVSGISQKVIEDECWKMSSENQIVVVSNYNTTEQTVISGHIEAVKKVSEKFSSLGARVIPLKVSAPFHSPLMQPAADKLKEELMKQTYRDLKWPVLSNVTSEPYPSNEKIVEYLSLQIVKPVKWQSSIEYLQNHGVTSVIEIGPQTVLKNMMKKNAPNIKAYTYDNTDDIKSVKKFLKPGLASGEVADGIKVITKCLATAVSTKNYNSNNEEFKKGVNDSFNSIRAIKDEIVKEDRNPTTEEMLEAMELLKKILVTKKISANLQKGLLETIINDTETSHIFKEFSVV